MLSGGRANYAQGNSLVEQAAATSEEAELSRLRRYLPQQLEGVDDATLRSMQGLAQSQGRSLDEFGVANTVAAALGGDRRRAVVVVRATHASDE